MYNYLHYYYPHLLKAEGRIKRVMPCKRLQYEVEFNVRHTDNTIYIYHKYLQWLR